MVTQQIYNSCGCCGDDWVLGVVVKRTLALSLNFEFAKGEHIYFLNVYM